MSANNGGKPQSRVDKVWVTVLVVAMLLAVVSLGVNGYVVLYIRDLQTSVDDSAIPSMAKNLDSVEIRLTRLEETVNQFRDEALTASDVVERLEPLFKEMESLLIDSQQEFDSRLAALSEKVREPEPVSVLVPVKGDTTLTVFAGDTLWDMARRFENPPTPHFIQKIMDKNGITDPRALRIGQVLIIPAE